MKDLRSRWHALLPLLALGTMLGCGTLQGGPSQNPENSSLTVITPTLDFGPVVIGSSKMMSARIVNRTVFAVVIKQADVAGGEFQMVWPRLPLTIGPGQSVDLKIRFSPQTAGEPSGTVAISTNAPQPANTIMLSGEGVTTGQLAAAPASLVFGSVNVGEQSTKSVVLTNPGGTDVTVNSIAVSGADYQTSGPAMPFTIGPGETSTLNVTFSPKSAGASSGSITISAGADTAPDNNSRRRFGRRRFGSRSQADTQAQNLTIALSGAGIGAGQLSANPSSVNFGSVQLNSSSSKTIVLQNSGDSSVSVSQATVSGVGFTMTGLNMSIVIAAGQSASFTVTYSPKSAGNASGNVAITSNGSNPLLNVPLSGSATTPGTLTTGSNLLDFGSVTVGATAKQSATLTNSGGSSVTINQVSSSGTGFTVSGISTPLNLAAGQSASLDVTFAPQSAGSASGTVTVASTAPNSPLTFSVTGTAVTAGSLVLQPASLSFGAVQTGSSKTLTATLNNSGGSAITVSQIAVSTGYTVSGITLPLSLGAGKSAALNVVFGPKSAGTNNGSLTITSNAPGSPLSVPLSGSGQAPGALGVSSSSLSFGSVQTGSTKTLQETVTNTGGSPVNVSSISASGAYSVTGANVPMTLNAGATTTFDVVFNPTAGGASNGTLTIASDASGSPLTVALTGTGATAGALSASSSTLTFGTVQTGANKSMQETLTNTGGSPVNVSQISASGAYSVTGASVPLTLNAGATSTFNVVFSPTSSGTANGTLTVTSDASASPLAVALTGTGATPGALAAGSPALSFGSVQTGSSKTLQETLTNSGGSSLTISQATVSGTGFSMNGLTLPVTLAAGASKTFNVMFSPQSSGNANGTLSVTSNASGSPLSVTLSGSGTAVGTLSATPTALSFGSVQVGNTSVKSAALSNSGGAPVTVSQVNVTGAAYSLGGLSLPVTLDVGESFTFNVTFAPQAGGSASGSITVVSDASNSPSISLSGSGAAVGSFAVSPTSFNFGSVTVGSSKNMTATLSASGAGVTVSSASVSSSEFRLTGPALPLVIAAGQTATFTLTFTPQSSGSASATVSFVTNAAGSPLVQSLSGTGTAPVQHRVDLSWSSSPSNVSGYNVYRSATSGSGYVKLNPALNVGTSYTDNSVQAGAVYFYVTTAVDASGTESINSNEVQATIPSP